MNFEIYLLLFSIWDSMGVKISKRYPSRNLNFFFNQILHASLWQRSSQELVRGIVKFEIYIFLRIEIQQCQMSWKWLIVERNKVTVHVSVLVICISATFDLLVLKVIWGHLWPICLKLTCNSNTCGCRVKGREICDARVDCIQRTLTSYCHLCVIRCSFLTLACNTKTIDHSAKYTGIYGREYQ